MSRLHSQQQGAVALVTAMIVSILLMITTAGMVSVTVKSMRQSTDGAQSTKAYYAAEGGLEETLLKLRNGETIDNCAGTTNIKTSAQDGVVTCARVTQNTNQVVGQLGKDESTQIDLSEVSGIFAIKIEWGLDNYDPATIPNYVTDGFPAPNKVDGTSWPATAPAALEASIIEYPKTSTFSIAQVGFYQSITGPKAVGSSMPQDQESLYIYTDLPNRTKPFVNICDDPAPYQCSTAPAGLKADKSYVLRLKSRYNGAKYRISAIGAGNAVLTIPNQMYTIDVTARAGDVFRRAQTSFSTVPTSVDGLDYVLYSDTEICKSYEIKDGAASGLNCQVP